MQLIFIKNSQLFFVFTPASKNIQPDFCLGLPRSINCSRIRDFCGALEEENLLTNFVLVYELIDEMIARSQRKILRTLAIPSTPTLKRSGF